MSYLKLGHTTNTSSWTNIHYNSIACRFCTSQRERACLDLFGHMRAFISLSRALRLSAVSHVWGRTGCEFLSDAPFFGLSLCTEFQLANCACASGWSCLMNFDLKFHLGRLGVAVLEEKMYVHSEVEVHTMYQRLFEKLLHSMQHLFLMLLLC